MAAKDKDSKKPPVWKQTLGGGLAGAIEVTIMYPTEYVKTQMQLQKKGSAAQFKNSWDCARTIVREKGFTALYRGLSSLVLGTVPKTSVRFTAFEQMKRLLRDEEGKLSAFRTMLAGATAGVIEATFVVTPVETMKTKLIHDQNSANPKYRGLVHGMRTVVAEEGIRGIYRGVLPTIAKQTGNQSIRFTTYETLKKWIKSANGGADIPTWQAMLAGGSAGFISVILTMPFDVVKTRMQGVDAHAYKGTVDCVSQVYRNEGVLAFWKGTAPRLPRVVFGQSIMLAGYDKIIKLLDLLLPN